MAQYKHNFYGTSYYGETNAFSGSYETAPILTEETLNNTFDIQIKAEIPSAEYLPNDSEIKTEGSWTEGSGGSLRSDEPNAKIVFIGTADQVKIKYREAPNGTEVNIKVTTSIPGEEPIITNEVLSSIGQLVQDSEFAIENLKYGHQTVEISLKEDNAAGAYFDLKSIKARVANIQVETRARLDSGEWSQYQKTDLVYTSESGEDEYLCTGVSPNYEGQNQIQLRIWMASSDNEISPMVHEITTTAGDTNRRTEDATYIAEIDMSSVAAAIGQEFSHIQEIDWDATVPEGTDLVIRTRSTNDDSKTVWSAKSAPYKKDTKRIKLKDGASEGYITTPLINPASVNDYLRIDQWNEWSDISHLPPDESDVQITYSFLDERNIVIHQINQPKYVADKSFINTQIGNKPYRLRIHLRRRFDKATPVVDQITLLSTLIYEQDHVVENYKFSAVDNQNTGERMILDMTDISYDIPEEATSPVFRLIDETQRPLDVNLYFDSARFLDLSIARSNETALRNDKIWALAKTNENPRVVGSTGVPKHYQYGGGSVIYGTPDHTPIGSSFTPSLKDDKEYRYYIVNGWLDPQSNTSVDDSVNNNVRIYWDTEKDMNENERTHLTDKSFHNGIVKGEKELASDIVISEILEESTWGEVEWVSEEKVFFGACNLNDLQGDYIRKHVIPESGDSVDTSYTVEFGDSYESIAEKFGIDSLDLRSVNNAEINDQPSAGDTLIIPSRIVLPKIDPLAKVGPNPYHIEIIHNSVRQGGRIVPDDRISRVNLEVEEEEVLIEKEEITRGTIQNGTDFLRNAKVTEIVGIWTLPDDPVLAPNYEEGLDYVLNGNAIDWSPSEELSKEPEIGSKYYVTYKCLKPRGVTVQIGSDYQEEGGIDRIWRSAEVKEFTGRCSPGVDHRAALPEPTAWAGADDPNIQDLEFIIEDNDLWVKTWVEYDPVESKYIAVGSLQDRVPKDNWHPYIHTGFYYLGKDEYYLYSEPIVVKPGESEIPKAANIEYVPGKYSSAARFSKGSKNLIKNSGFEVLNKEGTLFNMSFFQPYNGFEFGDPKRYAVGDPVYWDNGFTLDVEIYHDYDRNDDWSRIVQRGDADGGGYGFALRTYENGLVLNVSNYHGENIYSGPLSKGWYRVICRGIYDWDTHEVIQDMWINEVKVAKDTIIDFPGSDDDKFTVGRRSGTTEEYYWSGVLKNLRYWNRDLDDGEISSLFFGEEITDGLQGEWFTTHPSQDIVYDTSGNERHLTLYNSAEEE